MGIQQLLKQMKKVLSRRLSSTAKFCRILWLHPCKLQAGLLKMHPLLGHLEKSAKALAL